MPSGEGSLYGHPHAGDFWHGRFHAEPITLEFKTIDGWLSMYVRGLNNNDRIIICMYVDELVILGPKAMYPVLEALRKEIEMDDPHTLNKYLGCFHHLLETTVKGEKMMTIQFDMADYFKSACEIFVTETGETLKPAPTPFAPEVNSEDLDHLLNTPGKFSSKAAGFIMKLMYGARMAMPQICVIVSRLASQITKWSADTDRGQCPRATCTRTLTRSSPARSQSPTGSTSRSSHGRMLTSTATSCPRKARTASSSSSLDAREGASPWPGAPTSRDRRRCTPRKPRPYPSRNAAGKSSSPFRSSSR